MKFFVDTADVDEICDLAAYGLVDGVTTNPSIIAKSGRNFLEVIEEICGTVEGPVSAEVTATDWETMVKQGDKLASIADNVCVKLPLTMDGLRACYELSQKKIMTNVTLCFTSNQALMAAKVGATFISPFVGRLDDICVDGMELIEDITQIYENYGFETEVLVASIRQPNHVKEAAMLGADVVTVPPSVLRKLSAHPLTDAGLSAFLSDWEATGQSIL